MREAHPAALLLVGRLIDTFAEPDIHMTGHRHGGREKKDPDEPEAELIENLPSKTLMLDRH